MFKHLAAGAVLLGCVILASPVLAHLSVLETGQMQEMTGAAGICVPAVENACADKPQTTNALLPDNDRIKEVEASLKDTAAPVRPDPNARLLPETRQTLILAPAPELEVGCTPEQITLEIGRAHV